MRLSGVVLAAARVAFLNMEVPPVVVQGCPVERVLLLGSVQVYLVAGCMNQYLWLPMNR